MLCEGVVRMQCSMWDVQISKYSKKVLLVCVVQKYIRHFVDV